MTLRLSVVLILALLGWRSGDPGVLVLWVGIGIVSIVVHELGHALVARAAGAEPVVELAGMGGVTRYRPTPRTETRGWSLAIGLAGPAVGLGVGFVAIGLRDALGDPGGYPGVAWQVLVFTSIGWSLFNLLPIPPLDGGQAMTELLPGDPVERRRRGALVGIGTAALGMLAAVWFEQVFALVVLGLFAMQNWRTAQALRGVTSLPMALARRDWRTARRWFSEGAGDLAQLAVAQLGAAEDGEDQLAAELGELALARGATDAAFARRTATAWEALGADTRAAAARARAAELDPGRDT